MKIPPPPWWLFLALAGWSAGLSEDPFLILATVVLAFIAGTMFAEKYLFGKWKE